MSNSLDPTVSVLILNFNGLDDTRRCLESLAVDGEPDKEIILMDNGSRVDEAALVRERWGATVRIVRNDVNLGYAGGNNAAAALARGKYLVLLNNDTEVTPGWLTPLLKTMESDDRVGACQPKIRSLLRRDHFDEAGACGGYIDALGFPYLRGRVFSTTEKDVGQYDDVREVDFACGACMVIRRNLFLDTGGFDARLFAYIEEVDLCWRLRGMGYRMLCVPQSLIYHKAGQSWKNMTHTRLYHKHRNSLLVLAKNLTGLTAVRVIAPRLMLEWAAFAYYLACGDLRSAFAPVRSFFAFFVLAPSYVTRGAGNTAGLSDVHVVYEYFLRGRKTFADIRD